ncbi:hypothetical protein Taro_003520 [Colocasia esculenta]|uniref:Ubiquitin-like protease family profile domain-containing protein n=1 Tax=Colocasia esculenta TaxID=4460 RepID=A0A843TFP3_COLES|nr:hypothetical protein [Colocasia esculenta]
MHVLKVTYCRGHWNLLILCNLGKSLNNNYSLCMILLDSLIISEPLKAEPTIRRFVKDLYHTQGNLASSRSIGSILLLLSKVPQQRDGEECGVFTLYYIYLFLKSAPATFSFMSYPYFMTTTWFSYSEIDAFEHKIRTFTDLSLNDSPVMPCESEELEDEGDITMKKEKTGTDPDRADVFIITHTRKDGRPINEDYAIAIDE